MNPTYRTPLGRYTVTVTTATRDTLTTEEVHQEAEALTELLRRVYLASMGEHVKRGWTPAKVAAMVAKMKATRLARGIDWPRGDRHWTRRQW